MYNYINSTAGGCIEVICCVQIDAAAQYFAKYASMRGMIDHEAICLLVVNIVVYFICSRKFSKGLFGCVFCSAYAGGATEVAW